MKGIVSATKIHWKSLDVDPSIIAANSQRIRGRIKIHERGEPFDTEPVAIVGYGASLIQTWQQIPDFKIIYTCSGSHRFLVDRDIIPTYHVDSDPRAYKADILGKPHPKVTYLISSICHPTYFDKLELYRAKVLLWHIYFHEREVWPHYPIGDWIVTGGHTVGPRMVKIARTSGLIVLSVHTATHTRHHTLIHPMISTSMTSTARVI